MRRETPEDNRTVSPSLSFAWSAALRAQVRKVPQASKDAANTLASLDTYRGAEGKEAFRRRMLIKELNF